MVEEFRASRRKMKHYLILILVTILVLTSGVLVACGQNQKEAELKSKRDILAYTDEVMPLGEYYLETVQIVVSKEIASLDSDFQAKWFKEWGAYIELLKLNLESLSPPPEAATFHRIALDSFDKAILGLSELATVHEMAATSYDHPKWEQLSRGYDLIKESLKIWEEASKEMDKLIQVLNE